MEQHRYERVIIETARHRIEGTMTLARDGYRSRLSDVLNATEREFLALKDATVTALDAPGDAVFHPSVIVSRTQIVLAIPIGNDSPPPPVLSPVPNA